MSNDLHTFNLFDPLTLEPGEPVAELKAEMVHDVTGLDAVEVLEAEAAAPIAGLTPRIKGWPDNLRQVPNPMIRCGLFTVGNNKKTRLVWGAKTAAKIDSYGNMTVGFHGEEFRQDDLDVLLELLQVMRGQPVDAYARICPAHFIRDMGWTKNNVSYERLKTCIRRLQMGVISIKIYLNKEKTESFTYNGSLVKESAFYEDKKSPSKDRWAVLLDAQLYQFFDLKDYTLLNWNHRKQIHAPLGKFLHAFFSSHNGQFPIPVTKVMTLAGYGAQTTQAINKFRFDMKRYLQEMQAIGAIQKFKIDDDDRVLVTPMKFSLPKPAVKSPTAAAC